uniref:UDP-glucose 4-epimerase n=1 Tax=feces metagenome TaxID=1861841 RepID=A0A7M2QNL4_9ZZZZ
MSSRRMPALSPEEIRKISATAVANVAAQKIVTNANTGTFVKASVSGKVMSKKTHARKSKNSLGYVVGGGDSRKIMASSALSQSKSREYLQDSFNMVRKTIKA